MDTSLWLSSSSERGRELPRLNSLSPEEFISEYVAANRPVVVANAASDWRALSTWNPTTLSQRFGGRLVPAYDSLFSLVNIMTLEAYLERYFFQSSTDDPLPYVRWYTRQSHHSKYPWADDVFDCLADEWNAPSFFPASDGFALPYSPAGTALTPNVGRFPAQGLYLSPRGARTRLHYDPWCTDALLCQIYGRKRAILFEPSQRELLTSGYREFFDPSKPQLERFPRATSARITYEADVGPGDIIFFPRGWLHDVVTLSDSISLTWNFCLAAQASALKEFIANEASEEELKDINFFLFEHPDRKVAPYSSVNDI